LIKGVLLFATEYETFSGGKKEFTGIQNEINLHSKEKWCWV